MGAQVSGPLPPPHPATAFVSLYAGDELAASVDVEKSLSRLDALKKIRISDGPYTEYELKGTPWNAMLMKNRVRHQRNLALLIRDVASTVGPPIFSTDASRSGYLSVQMFLRSPSPVPMEVAAVALDGVNHLLLLTPHTPGEAEVRAAIERVWPAGINHSKTRDTGDAEINLKGLPWMPVGDDAVHIQALMCALHTTMLRAGWRHCIGVGCTINEGPDVLMYFRPAHGSPPPLVEGAAVCAISLNMMDTFRCIGVPPPVVAELIELVPQVWPRGVQRVEEYAGVPSIKLHGNPWWADGDEECIASRVLVCGLLAVMVRRGWDVFASLDISCKKDDKSAFYFLRAPPRPTAQIGAVSLNDDDIVRLIGLPPAVVGAARGAIAAWPPGVKREGVKPGKSALAWGVHQFKLNGTPWALVHDVDRRHTSVFVANLVGAVVAAGARPVTSADVSAKNFKDHNGNTCKCDVDTLFFEIEGDAAAPPVQLGEPVAPPRGPSAAWSIMPSWLVPAGAAPPGVPHSGGAPPPAY